MARASLDKVILHIANKQVEKLRAETKKRVDRYNATAQRQTNPARKDHYIQLALQAAQMCEAGVKHLLKTAEQAAKAVRPRTKLRKK